MFKAVIFDWDGTLAETTSAVVASFHKVFDELSFEVGEGFIESLTGTSAKEIFLEIFRTSQVKFDEETVRIWLRRELKLNWKERPS